MTAKEYVSQLIGINARIREAELTLAAMKREKDTLGAMRYDSVRVSGGVSSDLGDAVIRMQTEISKQYDRIKQLRDTKHEVEKTISGITDGRHATLLLLRYEHCCPWTYISEVLSTTHIRVGVEAVKRRMHKRALDDLDEILKRRPECPTCPH